MSKRVYISSDYSEEHGDRDVVETLTNWGTDKKRVVDFIDMAQVVSGSVSKNNPDCRACDLKEEFNQQINASSIVIFIIGDRTKFRTAGSSCERVIKDRLNSSCTPYKQNANGKKLCKHSRIYPAGDNVRTINNYSYLQHEFEQAKKKNKQIIILYNSSRRESTWLPSYMKGYESQAEPFWIKNLYGVKFGNYEYIKKALGF